MAVDPTKLRFGPYRTPRFKFGRKVICEIRGELTIVALSDGRIPWPIGAMPDGRRAMILYGDLAKAVRKEASAAVRYWWGVGFDTVWKWRKALGARSTPGDRAVRTEYSSRPEHRAMIAAVGRKFGQDPERRRKIAAAKIGKPRPPEVMEKLRRANVGRKLSAEHRGKLSIAVRKRGAYPPAAGVPWSKAEEELLRTLSVAEVAERTGRTISAVRIRRRKLGYPDGRGSANRAKKRR